MKCDERGNIYVTGPRGIWVISADGKHLGVIGMPEIAGNLNWGGRDWASSTAPARRRFIACG